MAILTLSDPTGNFECLLFSEQIERFGSMLATGMSAILDVEAEAFARRLCAFD